MFRYAESEAVQLISAEELRQWMSQEDAPLLIDVRHLEQHQIFNIGGKSSYSKNIPVDRFSDAINWLDPDSPIVLYCQIGQKSFNAASRLIDADFLFVYSLHGGIEAWKRSLENNL